MILTIVVPVIAIGCSVEIQLPYKLHYIYIRMYIWILSVNILYSTHP